MGDGMPKPRCVSCGRLAVDEYHWWEDDGEEIVWNLCASHCDFAMDVVESVAEIDGWIEREAW